MAFRTDDAWWSKTRGLMAASLAVLVIFGLAVPLAVAPLDRMDFLGFPLGYYMAAQGSLIVFVALVFWFAGRQDAIDREFGIAEDD